MPESLEVGQGVLGVEFVSTVIATVMGLKEGATCSKTWLTGDELGQVPRWEGRLIDLSNEASDQCLSMCIALQKCE